MVVIFTELTNPTQKALKKDLCLQKHTLLSLQERDQEIIIKSKKFLVYKKKSQAKYLP